MISTRHIQDIIDKLRLQQYRNTTWKNYYTIWKIFNAFYIKLDIKPHSWEDRLTLFIGYLVDQDKQSSTIKSYISAIRAVLRELGYKLSKDLYLVSALMKACKIHNDKVRIRFPIQKRCLQLIINQVDMIYDKQPFLAKLYTALFTTAYYGMFR